MLSLFGAWGNRSRVFPVYDLLIEVSDVEVVLKKLIEWREDETREDETRAADEGAHVEEGNHESFELEGAT